MLSKLIIAAVLIALFYVALMPKAGATSRDAAKNLVAAGATLLDVRTPEEFAAGHIPGARNLPVDSLAKAVASLDRSKPVVVYCRSGKRSAAATQVLRRAGFESVHDLGAMSNW